MPKHTPGPWEWYTSCSYRRLGLAERYEEIVYPVVYTDGHPGIEFRNEADKALIAAVTDLYAELAHLVRLLEPLEREGTLAVPGLATLNAARAALRKAEGRTDDA